MPDPSPQGLVPTPPRTQRIHKTPGENHPGRLSTGVLRGSLMGWDRLRVVAPEGVVKFVSKLTEFYPSSPYTSVFLPLIDKDILAFVN